MNLRPKRAREIELNLTPLIDVVFLLLIFFMVSTTFEREATLRVELPDASSADPVEESVLLDIVINAEGDYFVNGNRVINNRITTLRSAIRHAIKNDRSLPVVISADAMAPHHAVITAMDVVGQLGIERISFATHRVP
ncbi:MAG TPA: biopolymer transporter ExbD [Chromatiaceae bacterium]|jgi:biopolymer transport protein ExbD|nr:biopolymer transporter ExbD [Chromatiaceae bacterium]HIN81874.1 biopolymer transporter ExbD [Chromatiales bacterium]HIA07619.1 biopolymer transporter ExbD [Chromatiaceae bacterium]HIB83734.1 biopolymer transporter ExbD [Chromatiaceae bacterium]HIO14062.1 biopolymer transporter ExbD [Chromatiales bacterium]